MSLSTLTSREPRSWIYKILTHTFLAAVVSVLVVSGTVVNAEAHTASDAIRAGCGSGYSVVRDGTRTLYNSRGVAYGSVYLTYNSSTGMSCVVTRKTAFHGTSSLTLARLAVEGRSGYLQDWAYYGHYASVKAYARGSCVMYWGDIRSPSGDTHAGGGRWAWGNCG